MLDRKTFFDVARKAPFYGLLTADQVSGMSKILDEWERRRLTDTRWLAYMLATVFHETGKKMQPIQEMGSEAYLKSKSYYPWIGQGLVQVTWEANAKKFGATKPGDLLSWPVALRALFDGMINGMFTGKQLSDYFSGSVSDPINARRIINGTDKAGLIVGYHLDFLEALLTAIKAEPAPAVVAQPPIVPRPSAKPAKATVAAGAVVVAAGAGAVAAPHGGTLMAVLGTIAAIAAGIGAAIHFKK